MGLVQGGCIRNSPAYSCGSADSPRGVFDDPHPAQTHSHHHSFRERQLVGSVTQEVITEPTNYNLPHSFGNSGPRPTSRSPLFDVLVAGESLTSIHDRRTASVSLRPPFSFTDICSVVSSRSGARRSASSPRTSGVCASRHASERSRPTD